MKRITVGHTIHAFKDGGMERGLVNLVNYGDHERFRHVICCLTEAGAFGQQLASSSCTLVELHKREGNDATLPWRIASLARRYRMDVLHARGWPALVETILAAKLAGVRATVYGFHGRTVDELEGVSRRRRWAQRVFIRCYDRVVTLNPRMRADLAAESGLEADRIQIVANGVDVEKFRPYDERLRLRASLGLPQGRFILGNVARLDPVKNHPVILRALQRFAPGERPLLVIVGDGPSRSRLVDEIARRGLREDVRLFGHSDRIPELLNCMDLYVQSSLYEGFSNTLLEAMACGLAVLATDVGGTPDLVRRDQEGHLFEPSDDGRLASLIAKYRARGALRRAMADRARRSVVERFSVGAMVRRYEEVYLDVTPAGRHQTSGGGSPRFASSADSWDAP